MRISEIFYSLQGESTYAGLPCVFVRTAGCNLSCSYCDTEYAKSSGYILTPAEILTQIDAYPLTHLVEITGGEPLLQPDIYELFSLLHTQLVGAKNLSSLQILLETNGSIDLADVPDYVCKIIDIKTPYSCQEGNFLLSNLKYFHPPKDNLKFVLGSLSDYDWMKDFLLKNNLSGQSILVSTVFSVIKPQTIAEKILTDGLDVRFQLQIHKYIWQPDQRGV